MADVLRWSFSNTSKNEQILENNIDIYEMITDRLYNKQLYWQTSVYKTPLYLFLLLIWVDDNQVTFWRLTHEADGIVIQRQMGRKLFYCAFVRVF